MVPLISLLSLYRSPAGSFPTNDTALTVQLGRLFCGVLPKSKRPARVHLPWAISFMFSSSRSTGISSSSKILCPALIQVAKLSRVKIRRLVPPQYLHQRIGWGFCSVFTFPLGLLSAVIGFDHPADSPDKLVNLGCINHDYDLTLTMFFVKTLMGGSICWERALES